MLCFLPNMTDDSNIFIIVYDIVSHIERKINFFIYFYKEVTKQ
jgi:hypothetical protein